MQSLHLIQAEQVYVSREYPRGLTLRQYRALPCAARWRQPWRPMIRFAPAALRDKAQHDRGAVRVES